MNENLRDIGMDTEAGQHQGAEKLKSRLGLILLSAGCAIGLGNVWRFPYVAGENGGGIFVAVYILCLILVGVPAVMLEMSLGRATGKSITRAYEAAEPPGSWWHLSRYVLIFGPYILLGFYTVLTGWLLYYLCYFIGGDFGSQHYASQAEAGAASLKMFESFLGNPAAMLTATLAVIAAAGIIALRRVEKGLEAVTKPLMLLLFFMMIALAAYCLTLPGAMEGVRYYLYPDLDRFRNAGVPRVLTEALTQAFFTLSVGQGSLLVFGSYASREHSLVNESLYIVGLDFMVAFLAGLIIFPACFSYGLRPDSGPDLLFITMINVFSGMEHGQTAGVLFFFFMFVAAFTTVATVFEGNMAAVRDLFGIRRIPGALLNTLLITVLALPVIFGFNIYNDIHPLGGQSNFLDLWDFIVSTNILPCGALFMTLFAAAGWGFHNFRKEVNTGAGLRLPAWTSGYFRIFLPLIIVLILITGYAGVISKWSS